MLVAHVLLLSPPQLGSAGQTARSSELARAALFGDPHELFRGAELTAFGDVDGDGDLDAWLVQGSFVTGGTTLRLVENLGAGRVARHAVQLTLPYPAQVAELADLDGDLDLDLLVGDTLLLNDGRGGFTLDPTAQPSRLRALARELADFDGDLDLDVYASADGLAGPSDGLFLNDGSGHFSDASASLPAGAGGANWITSGDVDADGDADVLACGSGTAAGTARLYLNDGGAHFTNASAQLPLTGFRDGLSLVDVDADLDLDALGYRGLFLNDGGGAFSDASAQLPPSLNPSGIALATDLDGDGDPDLALGDDLWRNDGAGSYTVAVGALPEGYGRLTPGDVDGDGDVDLLRASAGDPYGNGATEDVLLNDGHAAFLSQGSLSEELPGEHGSIGLLVDMDGDGDLDAVTGIPKDQPFGSYEQKTFLGRNDGNGRFTDSTGSMPPIQTLPMSLAAADVEGDGDQDLLIGGFENDDGSAGGLDLMLQVGGVFLHPSGPGSHQGLGGKTTDIAVGDLDGDGDLDVLHGNTWTFFAIDGVLYNDGGGTFVYDAGLSAFVEAYDVELLDLERDGDLDALISGASAKLYRRDGTGWTDASAQLSFAAGWRLACGDVDLDGDADLLVGDLDGARLHENDGTGSFALARTLAASAPAFSFAGVHLDDVDSDGDLDAFVQGDELELFENAGGGALHPSAWLANATIDRPAFGDVDQDGDRDLLSAGLHFNRLRQLSWCTRAQLGRTLTLELHGPKHEPWTLFSSPATGRFAIPLQGILLLGPPLSTRGAGTLERHGNATFQTSIPSTPALIGTTLYWQALVGAPARFTNRETTTISGH